MIPTLLGLAWAGLALLAMASLRPPPSRVRSLCRPTPAAGQASTPGRRAPLEALGYAALRLARRSNAEPAQARALGAAVLGTAFALALAPVLVPVPLACAWALPRVIAGRDERRRLQRLEADLPETVDLLALAVGAGCNVTLAIGAAGRRGTGPLAAELRRVTAEVGRGRRLADALDDLPGRAGESTRPLASALAACERYGPAGAHPRAHRRRRPPPAPAQGRGDGPEGAGATALPLGALHPARLHHAHGGPARRRCPS